MENLMQLLLEAPITKKYADLMISKGNQVSVYYNKKWIKIEPVKVVDNNGVLSLVAYQVGGPDELQSYEFDKLTNWNLLSNTKASKAANEKKREKKEKKPAVVTPAVVKPGGSSDTLSDKIAAAVNNKRVVNVYYMGDKEEPAGLRTGVLPVFYGTATKKVRGVTPGKNYVRVWVGGGKTVSGEKVNKDGEKNTKKALPQWRFFREDRIKQWEVDGEKTFDRPPDKKYNENGDKMIHRVIAAASFDKLQESAMVKAIMDAVKIL